MENKLTARVQKIAALETKLAELKDAERVAEQRRKSVKSRTERAAETRRKVLLGAFVLDQLGALDSAAQFAIGACRFGEWLVRDSDRAAFCLSPLAHPALGPAFEQAQGAGGGS